VLEAAGCTCGDTHSRDDAGAPDAAAADVLVIDVGVVGLDAAAGDAAITDAPPPDAGPRCTLAARTSTLAGTTPLGAVSFPFGWAGLGNTSKACFGVALHATDTDVLYGWPARSLWMWLPRSSAEPILGRHTGVTVMLEVDGMTAMTSSGVVDVTAYTRDDVSVAVEASVDVLGDGFDVHGTLAVPYCVVFSDPCI
jgi:hypothetical protein